MSNKKPVGFSQEWDGRYKAGTHQSVWPWSDVVSLCERYIRPSLKSKLENKVLEVGCGYGANIPYLLTLGRYFGIDGSQTALNVNLQRFPELQGRLQVCDFTKEIVFKGMFDVICDRASITHNSDAEIRKCIDIVRTAINIGGYFLGVAWFSKAHTAYLNFEEGEQIDSYTRTGYTEGQFSGVGAVHFTDEENIREIFEGFDIIYLEHKVSTVVIPSDKLVNAFYNFVAIRQT